MLQDEVDRVRGGPFHCVSASNTTGQPVGSAAEELAAIGFLGRCLEPVVRVSLLIAEGNMESYNSFKTKGFSWP